MKFHYIVMLEVPDAWVATAVSDSQGRQGREWCKQALADQFADLAGNMIPLGPGKPAALCVHVDAIDSENDGEEHAFIRPAGAPVALWRRLRPRWFWGESPAEVLWLLFVCVAVPLLVFVFRNVLFRKVTGR